MDEYPVIITRRRTSRLSIRVTKDGEVRVSAPRLVPRRVINEFVASHREWIDKALERVGRQQRGREAFYARLDVSTPALRKAAAARLAEIVTPMVERYAAALSAELTPGGSAAAISPSAARRPGTSTTREADATRTSAHPAKAIAPSAKTLVPSAISYRCTRTRWGS